MKIKADAYERIQKKRDAQVGGDEAIKQRLERREHLLRKQMESEDGREFLWEFVADARSLRMNAYTGNADCYYILGLKRNAEALLESAKRTSLSLYHKMEAEAQQREET